MSVFVAPPVGSINASPRGFVEIQPNGTRTPTMHINGDPCHHFMSHNGFPVTMDGDCYYVYAMPEQLPNGTLTPSTMRVGDVDPEKEGFQKAMTMMNSTIDSDARMCRGLNSRRLESTDSTSRQLAASKRKNLVLLIRFADHKQRQLPSPDEVDILFNAPNGHSRIAPSGSIRDVYLKNSYGRFDLQSKAYGWYTLPKTEEYYAGGKSGLSDIFLEAVHDALDLAAKDPSLNFRSFDDDNDGIIDTLTLLHSSYAAEWGSTDSYGASMYDRIWSHKWGLSSSKQWKNNDIKAVTYVTVPALWGTGGSSIGRIGVIAHELGHYFGLPDLYGGMGGNGVGSYDMQANSWGYDGSQQYPPMLSPWSKLQKGWLTATKITSSGRYSLEASAEHPQVYRIDIGVDKTEFLLIENRQQTFFDEKLPQGGLCIWHIDDKAGHREAGYPGYSGWPGNGKHYRVALLQADGNYDLERGDGRGDAGDVYHKDGVNAIGPSKPDGSGPFPNTDAYQGGNVKRSGVSIYDVSRSGSVMQFSVTIPGSSNATPPTKPPANAPTPDNTSPRPKKLSTNFKGDNGAAGNMFNVLPINDVTLFGMEIHTKSEERAVVKVWTKLGTYVGFETKQSAWTQIVSTQIECAGRDKKTFVPIDSLRMKMGQQRAFYVTMADGDGLRYTNGVGVGSKYAANTDIEIFEGVGKRYPFGSTFQKRQWNGVLHYYLGANPMMEPDVTSPPTPSPTASPATTKRLETTMQAGTGQAGNMFDVLAFEDVLVTGFDIHTSLTSQLTVEIYTKADSHEGFERNCGAWTLLATVTTTGRGRGNPTPLPNSIPPITLKQLHIQAFYITVKTSGRGLLYTKGKGRGSLAAADDSLVVIEGTGNRYKCGRSYLNRIWNGAIHYTRIERAPSSPTDPQAVTSLSSTFIGGKQAGGNMFDLTARAKLSIIGMDIHASYVGSATVEIFTLPDTYDGFESNPGAWTLIMSRNITSANGRGEATPVPDFSPISIDPDSTMAFYVTLTSEDMRYTDGSAWGSSMAASDDNLSVSKGIGVEYPYGQIYLNRVWNGVLKYKLEE